MRLAGRVIDWNDAKGFGFVTPNGGGTRAFVHINAFQRGARRPVDGDLVSYLPAIDGRGRTNAKEVRHAGQKAAMPRQPSRVPRTALGALALLAAAVAGAMGWLPFSLVGWYLAASLVTFFIYRADKMAARRERRRTPEATLHMAGLVGGWPGALFAQQLFRHKTVKQPFQAVFWVTVALNLATLGWLAREGWLARLSTLAGS